MYIYISKTWCSTITCFSNRKITKDMNIPDRFWGFYGCFPLKNSGHASSASWVASSSRPQVSATWQPGLTTWGWIAIMSSLMKCRPLKMLGCFGLFGWIIPALLQPEFQVRALKQSHQHPLQVPSTEPSRYPGIWTKILDTQLRVLRSCPQLQRHGWVGSRGHWDVPKLQIYWVMIR